ncbi:glycoside hydrolase family 10 protein [Frigoriflavimonas asaccharolytica]|uniref:Uncharacterized lipoprotein YddW (UPF0748 family) n=1 Tax=Frigoriflavimonas asaccharolytica TaxID=2735899 RepID=A0A8J8G849_9FLAO|nr:family 10 glycosylhydrolase [Frigoriflavimonas asaccharolytica]NRS91274.1 uncharacterized lipoprotein YddW (UPF0748 family) [Frigoriflavimonas asaccharolytica]
MFKFSNCTFLLFFLLIINQNCSSQPAIVVDKPIVKKENLPTKIIKEIEKPLNLPEINREFRGVWIATVANINWPSKNNLSTEQQKAEAINLLDLIEKNNFNAVVFQARPSADALYKSNLEPWSFFLNGETGKAPNPYYDPLEFWISEAHKRGLELHVWLNPYRAHHTTGGKISKESLVNKMPDEIVKLKNGTYWMDPSNEKTQDHVSAVVKDLVKRYDLDAIHFDDYFYPYAEYNYGADFPDSKSWIQYLKSGGTLEKADWRRANVNKFVKRIHDEIKQEKTDVQFGISPFGIWKSGFPADVKGTSQYDELFADAKLWLNQGWVDYFSPQLYWKMDAPEQRFQSLYDWWQSENTLKRHLYPGLNTVGVKNVSNRSSEIYDQINAIRQSKFSTKGEIHYSIAGISKDNAMQDMFQNQAYKEKALVPLSPWIKTKALDKPSLEISYSDKDLILKFNHKNLNLVRNWILYTEYGNVWTYKIYTKDEIQMNLASSNNGKKLTRIALQATDRLGNESIYDLKTIK